MTRFWLVTCEPDEDMPENAGLKPWKSFWPQLMESTVHTSVCVMRLRFLQTPQRSSLPLPGLALSGAFFPSWAFPNQWTVKETPGVNPTTSRGFTSPAVSPSQGLHSLFHRCSSLRWFWKVMRSDCTYPQFQRKQCHGTLGPKHGAVGMQRWGDLNHPPLPTFPAEVVSKRQQHCRPAPGKSCLSGPREEGCRKINGQHPFTVMGFCLGQWASSSY